MNLFIMLYIKLQCLPLTFKIWYSSTCFKTMYIYKWLCSVFENFYLLKSSEVIDVSYQWLIFLLINPNELCEVEFIGASQSLLAEDARWYYEEIPITYYISSPLIVCIAYKLSQMSHENRFETFISSIHIISIKTKRYIEYKSIIISY